MKTKPTTRKAKAAASTGKASNPIQAHHQLKRMQCAVSRLSAILHPLCEFDVHQVKGKAPEYAGLPDELELIQREAIKRGFSGATEWLTFHEQHAKPSEELLSHQTSEFFKRLDLELGLAAGHGVAEVMLSEVIRQLREGDFSLITEGWSFERPELVEPVLRAVLEDF